MSKGAALTLLALGAILAFAVNGHPSWLNIQVVGWVIMATGAAGLLIPRSGYAAVRRRVVRRRTGPNGPVTEVDERRYPPYIRLNPNAMTPVEDPADLVAGAGDLDSQEVIPPGVETVDEYVDDLDR
jgi:Domain of unknown function (DUF6458)